MNSVIAWFAENRVAANLLMVLTLVAGSVAMLDARKETFPNIVWDEVGIYVAYPGATPSEVEKSVAMPIEDAIADLDGVGSVTSVSKAHAAAVKVKVAFGSDTQEIKELIQNVVSGIKFPSNVQKPRVVQSMPKQVVGNVVVSGKADERTLKRIAENVRRDLLSDPKISQVKMVNVRPYEIAIEVSETSMQRYGLSFAEVSSAIKRQSVDIPAGSISNEFGKMSIIAQGEISTKDTFEEIIVRSQPDGGRVYLRDVAGVIDGFQQGSSRSEYNGEPAVYLSVMQVGGQNILEIADSIHKYVESPTTYLPEGIKIGLWNDASVYFKSRIDLLLENAAVGLGLVFFILMLFLRWRLSFWVSLGIPISFMGAFWMLPIFGGSINMISLFAFILVLGIVVDDAIIVGENIFTHQKAGNVGLSGAISGAQEVATPVVFAVLTTIVMFSPLLFLPGPEGKLMYVVPLVVISTLVFSLLESLLILPAHLSVIKPRKSDGGGVFGRFQLKFESALEYVIREWYQPFLERALHWRYAVGALFFALFILSSGLLSGGWIKTVMFSEIEADISVANVAFAQGSTAEVTKAAIQKIERAAIKLKSQLYEETGEEQVKNVLTIYGKQLFGGKGDHLGSVVMEMVPSESRIVSGAELNRRWRDIVGDIQDVMQLNYDSTFNKPGPAIDIKLTHEDPSVLKESADKLKVYLSEFEGVYDITDTFERGQSEISLHLKPVAADLHLKMDSVANQVRQAFHGTVVQSVQRGSEEVKVIVRYPSEERSSLWYLENMNIRLADGSSIPLLTVADVEYGSGPTLIRRTNGMRVIRVKANVDPIVADSAKIMKEVKKQFLPQLAAKWGTAGAQQNAEEFKKFLLKGYVIALLVMYILMAILFKSYIQPVMVMFAVPFGLVGALAGHMVIGIDVTLWSLIGMCAVSGVVVNDNLVMVDYINRKARDNVPMIRAIRESGGARFRPIVLTSITTFGGLAPLMVEKSIQAQFLIPMAVSLAFGVLFVTFVTLILVPCIYHILEDLQDVAKKYLPNSLFHDASGTDSQGLNGLSGALKAANDKLQNNLNTELALDAVIAAELMPSLAAEDLVEPFSASTLQESEAVLEALSDPKLEDGFTAHRASGDNSWNDDLDGAYDKGYDLGLKGCEGELSEYDAEEMTASWEAGYNDGLEAFALKRQT